MFPLPFATVMLASEQVTVAEPPGRPERVSVTVPPLGSVAGDGVRVRLGVALRMVTVTVPVAGPYSSVSVGLNTTLLGPLSATLVSACPSAKLQVPKTVFPSTVAVPVIWLLFTGLPV